MTTATTEHMISETLGPDDMTILLVDLKAGERAEAVIYAGLPGTLIADGHAVVLPDDQQALAVHWQNRLEWHIHNTANQEKYFGLRYKVWDVPWYAKQDDE